MTSQIESMAARTSRIFDELQGRTYRQTDRIFRWLMVAQWVFGVIVAFVESQSVWSGTSSSLARSPPPVCAKAQPSCDWVQRCDLTAAFRMLPIGLTRQSDGDPRGTPLARLAPFAPLLNRASRLNEWRPVRRAITVRGATVFNGLLNMLLGLLGLNVGAGGGASAGPASGGVDVHLGF